jgi:hypothetical protein
MTTSARPNILLIMGQPAGDHHRHLGPAQQLLRFRRVTFRFDGVVPGSTYTGSAIQRNRPIEKTRGAKNLASSPPGSTANLKLARYPYGVVS